MSEDKILKKLTEVELELEKIKKQTEEEHERQFWKNLEWEWE